MTLSLFPADSLPAEIIDDGAVLLRGFAAAEEQRWVETVQAVQARAPFRNMQVPGGKSMSVAITNCGGWGWVSDTHGYRYSATDPQTGRPWPGMPAFLAEQASAMALTAGYAGFAPDACLINRYRPGARMGLHRDQDEADLGAPIVSVSLGLPAVFLWGGATRAGRALRVPLRHGDVVVWGGVDRLRFHGVLPVAPGEHPATGQCRINLTLRKAL